MGRALFFFVLLLAGSATRRAAAALSYTVGGCECAGNCERTIDSPFVAWCTTTALGIDESANATAGCPTASYSRVRRAYWDSCVQNTTGTGAGTERVFLITFPRMWMTITVSAVGAAACSYFLMGCAAAALTSPRKAWWLPPAAALIGALQGLLVGGAGAAILSFLYLSLPYALERAAAAGLGLGLAVLASYSALGRSHTRPRYAHGSEVG